MVFLTNAEKESAYQSVRYHILDHYLGGATQDYIAAFKADDDRENRKLEEAKAKAMAGRIPNTSPSLPLVRGHVLTSDTASS